MSLSPAHSRRLALERIHTMEDRILLEKEACRGRQKAASPLSFLQYETTHDVLVRELRSLRQLPIGDPVLENRKELMATCMDQSSELSTISALFELPPLRSLENLRYFLLPLFSRNDPNEIGVLTWTYYNMIVFVQSSLRRLCNVKASSLHDRIDPWGPGSPEFSPPYTCIDELAMGEGASRALVEQIESVQMIEFRDTYSRKTLLFDALTLFETLPSSLSLTTAMFCRSGFDTEATSLVSSVLQRHPGIICLAFQDCAFVDRGCIDGSIITNRQNWREEAQSGDVFTYKALDLADLFAMVYIPQDGRVVPRLSLQAFREDIAPVASLAPSDDGGSDGALTTEFDVAASYGFQSLPIEGLPEVKAGCYELRVRLAGKAQYLFRRLTIDFIVASDGAELPGADT
ncbi:hypothetical protein PQX77_007416 [Marasmius sp. AFHP31]|nr:hypothetical protein PQX77_007416 [Marasmius sp. AFHP31]